MMGNLIKDLKNKDFTLKLGRFLLERAYKKKKYPKKRNIEFVDRGNIHGYEDLLLILAGFQPDYWEILFARVRAIIGEDQIDVCVCIPGVGKERKEILYRLCEKYGFASCYNKEDRLASTQNYAIRQCDKARYIYKIDEDMVLSNGFFRNLKEGIRRFPNTTRYQKGFAAPMINLNAYSYISYLETMGLIEEYEKQVGPATYTMPLVWSSKEAADFIWNSLGEKTFDQLADEIEKKNKGKYAFCSQRFSIGAFLMTRELWEEIDGFRVGSLGEMGFEEYVLCCHITDHGYVIYCCLDTLVGHLGYYHQKETCRNYFLNHKEKFVPHHE